MVTPSILLVYRKLATDLCIIRFISCTKTYYIGNFSNHLLLLLAIIHASLVIFNFKILKSDSVNIHCNIVHVRIRHICISFWLYITQYYSTVYIRIAMVCPHWKPYIRILFIFTFNDFTFNDKNVWKITSIVLPRKDDQFQSSVTFFRNSSTHETNAARWRLKWSTKWYLFYPIWVRFHFTRKNIAFRSRMTSQFVRTWRQFSNSNWNSNLSWCLRSLSWRGKLSRPANWV